MLELGMDHGLAAALTEMVATSTLRNAYVAMVASRGVPLIPGTRIPATVAIISMPGAFHTFG